MTYPTTLDTTTTIPVESANTKLSTNHVDNHTAMQTAIIAIETKLGIDGSAVTSTHDYKLSSITGSTKAVSDTNGTLTAPTLTLGSDATGDIFYRGSDGKVKRLGVGTNGQILKLAAGLPSWDTEATTANASTTVAGIVEEATQSEVEGRTATGGTGARLAITTSNITTVKTYDYQADSVGTDSYAITCTPAPTAYTTGMRFTFKAGTENTGACSLNVNSLGAKTIKKQYNLDLSTGDILANQIVEVVYDGTNFQLVSAQQPRPFFKSGNTTRDLSTATGTQTIAHGLGVTPRYVRISFRRDQSDLTGPSGIGNLHEGIGTFDGSNYNTWYTGSNSSSSSAGNYTTFQTTSYLVAYNRGAVGSDVSQLATASLDATNITLSWTKTNSPTGTLLMTWEAFA